MSGDLEEMFSALVRNKGLLKANNWYRVKIMQSIPALIKNYLKWSMAMYRNYLKIALRNVVKYKSYPLVSGKNRAGVISIAKVQGYLVF